MDKQACREWAKERLSKEKEQSHYLKSKKTLANLDELLTQLDAKNILTFIPMGFEPKVLDIVKTGKNKRRFFVPFMQDVSFKMVPYRLPLKKKRFNIYEAPYSSYALTKIDTAIVPILALDNTHRRIGFGKGMYDRFFETLAYKPTIIFVQLTCCYCDSNVTNDYDIKGDYLVTAKKILELTKATTNDFRTNCSNSW
jgi:5-formyltetrahydrofolate cyclo-ligase